MYIFGERNLSDLGLKSSLLGKATCCVILFGHFAVLLGGGKIILVDPWTVVSNRKLNKTEHVQKRNMLVTARLVTSLNER